MNATHDPVFLHEQAARPILPKVAAGFSFTHFERVKRNA